MLRYGRHYTGGQGVLNALDEIRIDKALAGQVFPGSNLSYKPSAINQTTTKRWREGLPSDFYLAVHSSYFINLAENPKIEKRELSIQGLVDQLIWAEAHGASSLVVHGGSGKDYPHKDALEWLIDGIDSVLIRYKGPVNLLIENSAGDRGNRYLCSILSELFYVIDQFDDNRLGVCIDTAHAWAAGYHLADQVYLLDHIFGEKLRLIHFNQPDKGALLGHHQDRHSTALHRGEVPLEWMRSMFIAYKDLPMVLEGTPAPLQDFTRMQAWDEDSRAIRLINIIDQTLERE